MGLFNDFYTSKIKKNLKPYENWQYFPKASDRNFWDNLTKDSLQKKRYDELKELIKSLPENPYPALPCQMYMEFRRNGNRSRYEALYFQRRQNFALFVMAECFEGKGVYLDQVIEGFWQMLSEVTWVIPAHADTGSEKPLWLNDSKDPLPIDTMETVDLFSAETAYVLSEALYLLEDQLMAVSPNLVARVRNEILKRVIEPVEIQKSGFWWWGGRNNWSVWCSFNILGAAFTVIKDLDRLARLTYDLMGVIDRFFDKYSDDGACDEGPMYWGVSAGMLFLFLETLESRIGNLDKIYENQKLINMTKYLCDVQLHKNNFANFSDSNSKVNCLTPALFIAGLKTKNSEISRVAWLNHFEWNSTAAPSLFTRKRCGGDINFMIRDIIYVKAPENNLKINHEKFCWYPKLEIGVFRENEDSDKGLIFYCKGGTNGENHNHNDVGQFCLMKNGQHIFIDIGNETYTRDTFNEKRYTLWNTRASGHNIPILNGNEQVYGRERRATEVQYISDNNQVEIKMNLAAAYEEKSHIKNYYRSMKFNLLSKARLEIKDEFLFNQDKNSIDHPIYAAQPAVVLEPGKLLIGSEKDGAILLYDASKFKIEITPIALTDPITRSSWGEAIYKILLKGEFSKNGFFSFVLE